MGGWIDKQRDYRLCKYCAVTTLFPGDCYTCGNESHVSSRPFLNGVESVPCHQPGVEAYAGGSRYRECCGAAGEIAQSSEDNGQLERRDILVEISSYFVWRCNMQKS